MDSINIRIDECVRDSGLTKTRFAKRINLTQQYISSLCNGRKTPSDRTIIDICRTFDVNEEWLRYGNGEMHIKTPDDVLDRWIQEFKYDSFLQKIVGEYLKLTEEQRDIVRNYIYSITSEEKNISDSKDGYETIMKQLEELKRGNEELRKKLETLEQEEDLEKDKESTLSIY